MIFLPRFLPTVVLLGVVSPIGLSGCADQTRYHAPVRVQPTTCGLGEYTVCRGGSATRIRRHRPDPFERCSCSRLASATPLMTDQPGLPLQLEYPGGSPVIGLRETLPDRRARGG